MAHPFFDSSAYPWARPEAGAFFRALLDAYPQPPRIDLLYRQCQAGLPPLALGAAPDIIWKDALDHLASRGALRRLCDLVQADPGLQRNDPFQAAVAAVLNAQPLPAAAAPAAEQPWVTGKRRRLETQYGELQRRFDALSNNIAALDKDLDRETDSLRKHSLESRKADTVAEREKIEAGMAQLERELAALP